MRACGRRCTGGRRRGLGWARHERGWPCAACSSPVKRNTMKQHAINEHKPPTHPPFPRRRPLPPAPRRSALTPRPAPPAMALRARPARLPLLLLALGLALAPAPGALGREASVSKCIWRNEVVCDASPGYVIAKMSTLAASPAESPLAVAVLQAAAMEAACHVFDSEADCAAAGGCAWDNTQVRPKTVSFVLFGCRKPQEACVWSVEGRRGRMRPRRQSPSCHFGPKNAGAVVQRGRGAPGAARRVLIRLPWLPYGGPRTAPPTPPSWALQPSQKQATLLPLQKRRKPDASNPPPLPKQRRRRRATSTRRSWRSGTCSNPAAPAPSWRRTCTAARRSTRRRAAARATIACGTTSWSLPQRRAPPAAGLARCVGAAQEARARPVFGRPKTYFGKFVSARQRADLVWGARAFNQKACARKGDQCLWYDELEPASKPGAPSRRVREVGSRRQRP